MVVGEMKALFVQNNIIQENGEILLSTGRETRIVGAVDEVSWQVAI